MAKKRGYNPKRHHYIPRFLLRPFSVDGKKLHYCDKETHVISDVKIDDIFMVRNLYRDDINNADNPVKLEQDFSKFENEVAHIISKFKEGDDIAITTEEADALKLFMAITSFRSNSANKMFGEDANEEFKEFYSHYQEDCNFNDLWKRNLECIVNCRSAQEVMNHPDIDDPIKLFMMRDSESIGGMYLVIAERRGKEEFILSDALPTRVYGMFPNGGGMPIYTFFPITPDRVIFQVVNILDIMPEKPSDFDYDFFKRPKISEDRKTIIHHVRKIYEPNIKRLNSIALDSAEEGFVFKNRDNVSIDKFEAIYKSLNM